MYADDDVIDFEDEMFEEDFEDEGFEIYEPEEPDYIYAIRPNKTQIKQEIAAIAAFAEKIVTLTSSQLNALELAEPLHLAVREAAVMPHKGARKRQLKYITAALRKLDVAALEEKVARLTYTSAHSVREHHQAEQWRDRLVNDTAHAALTQLLDQFPHADRQYIHQLQRNAKKEATAHKPPKSARLLYQYLKTLFANTTYEKEHADIMDYPDADFAP